MQSNLFFINQRSVSEPATMDMELEKLLTQISEYEYELHKNEKNLMLVKKFFDREELWPDQCEYAVQVLVNIGVPVRNLNRLLDIFLSFSRVTEVNRYAILVKVHYLDKEISELESQISRYREICQSKEKNRSGEYNKIVAKLEKTWEGYLSLRTTLEKLITQSIAGISTC